MLREEDAARRDASRGGGRAAVVDHGVLEAVDHRRSRRTAAGQHGAAGARIVGQAQPDPPLIAYVGVHLLSFFLVNGDVNTRTPTRVRKAAETPMRAALSKEVLL